MIVSFTVGQPSGDWIKDTLKYSDGRKSMNALRTHFAGEGNTLLVRIMRQGRLRTQTG